eukprot:3554113-Pyramimonas_sp.AAC.1
MGPRCVSWMRRNDVKKACERSHWGLRWNSLRGHATCEGCTRIVWRRRAILAIGASDGASSGATECMRGAPT